MTKRNLYLCQFNFMYGNDVFMPYSVGVLWSYARSIPAIEGAFRNAGIIFIREAPDKIAESMQDPDVVAFSTYVWNWEMSVEVARRVKARHPRCLVVFGGPQVPDRMGGFFERYPFIDVAVHGEGEQTFAQILLARAEGRAEEIPGISVNDGRAGGEAWKPRERLTDINSIPSPYLSGVFDGILGGAYSFQPIWETNRGCPYHCTFCDWGSLTYSKVRMFDMDRLLGEVDWFGRNKMSFIFGADANFGIMARDMELARALVSKKIETNGYPGKFRVSFAKNSTSRVLEIATVLNEQKMDKGITLSVQSMDEDTLKTVKRTNIKIESLSHFVREYQKKGIPTYTELILGLPRETYGSFKEGVEKLLVAGVHDSLAIYNCTVLPNAELNDPAYRAEQGIQTRRVPIFLNHSTPGTDPVQEYEEMIIGNRTLPLEDWKRQYVFAWIVQTLQTLNLTQVVTICLNGIRGLRYSDFYEDVLSFAEDHPETLLGQELRFVRAKVEEVLAGGSWDIVLDEFSDITWTTDEASYLRLSKDFGRFYSELGGFLRDLNSRRSLGLDEDLISDLLRYQEAIVVKWGESGTRDLDVGHSLHDYYRSVLTGEPAELQKGGFRLSVRDPFGFAGDKRKYAREIIWWGRKGGKFVYEQVHQEALNPRPAAIAL